MNKLFMFVFVLAIASNSLLGQSLPTIVDNSRFFPPVRTQSWGSCQTFSLVYNLKSYSWNVRFQRDPSLLENQFSPDYVWNLAGLQSATSINHWIDSYGTYILMSDHGAATIADFPFPQQVNDSAYQEVIPDLSVREKALRFRSVGLENIRIRGNDLPQNIEGYLDQLKDSLSQGICFALGFKGYVGAMDRVNIHPQFLYEYAPGDWADSATFGHQVTVVGYDDNLGAFKAVNSWGEEFGDKGYYYFDYDWFFTPGVYDAYFLIEDFGSIPQLTLNLEVSGFISGLDRQAQRYVIIDTLHQGDNGMFDIDHGLFYFYYPNLLKLLEVNGEKVSKRTAISVVEPNGNYQFVNDNSNIYLSLHNHNDDYYQTIRDLTDYSQADSFRTATVMVSDPISGLYIDENDNIVSQYQREAKAVVGNSYVHFLGSNKIIEGREIDLGDTTVTLENYDSRIFWRKIKKSVCTFKRTLIVFNVDDMTTINQAPTFVYLPDTLSTRQDSVITADIQAHDLDGDPLVYSVIGGGAVVDSLTGQVTFVSSEVGNHKVTVVVSDGKVAVGDSFVVIVIEKIDSTKINQPPVFVTKIDTLAAPPDSEIVHQIEVTDPDGDEIRFGILNPIEGATIDSLTGLFRYKSNRLGIYDIKVTATDGTDTVVDSFYIKIDNTVAVISDPYGMPTEYDLSQNYPNPFNPVTTIKFSLASVNFVTLKVYNLLGEEVALLVNEELQAGIHRVTFDAVGLPSGLYLYTIEAGSFRETRKMVLIK